MSDDLVERLRGMDGDSMSIKTIDQAADRIEELGKACKEWSEVSQRNYQRAKAAEAALAAAYIAGLEAAAEVAGVCHAHIEYGEYYAPSKDTHHDTPAEIRALKDPALVRAAVTKMEGRG